MTKIYLVVFSDKENRMYGSEVFTNKKKAVQYQRYWREHIKNEQQFEGHKVSIIIKRINNYDYTQAANEEEMKNLPY